MSSHSFQAGQIFLDKKFILKDKIGQGAYSEVYLTEDTQTEEQLAVKLAFSEKEASCLYKEHEILLKLIGNENIVQVKKLVSGPRLETMREDGSIRKKSRQPLAALFMEFAPKGSLV